jgi:hypothetical protein
VFLPLQSAIRSQEHGTNAFHSNFLAMLTSSKVRARSLFRMRYMRQARIPARPIVGLSVSSFLCRTRARNIVVVEIALLAKTQAPLAVKTREESITSIEKFEEFGLAGMCHHPATTTHKEAVLVRELIHQAASHHPMKPN